MNTWLYLTAEGVATPSADWPCCVWPEPLHGQTLPLNQAAHSLRGQAIDLLLPMELCSWVRSDPWPSRRKPDAQTIAFAVEEQLSETLEILHLSVGARDSDGRYPVMVIARERFSIVLALLADAGIEVRSVFVDADVLPSDQPYGVWWCGRWLLGGGLPARVAASEDALTQLRPALPLDIQWLGEQEAAAHIDQWLTAPPAQAIDLLQGAFTPRRQRLPGRLVGVSILTLLLLTWGAGEARIQYLGSESRQLLTLNEQRFKTLYPEQTRIVDMAAQLNALQRRSVEPQHTRVAGLINLIETVIGASQVEVLRVEFVAGDGWKIQLTANSFAELEQLRERGRQHGVPLRLDSASKALDRVQATLIVEEGA